MRSMAPAKSQGWRPKNGRACLGLRVTRPVGVGVTGMLSKDTSHRGTEDTEDAQREDRTGCLLCGTLCSLCLCGYSWFGPSDALLHPAVVRQRPVGRGL